MVPSVFLSSTFADFEEERQILMEVIPYIDVHVHCAERKGTDDDELEHNLKRWIDESDMVVLLVGMRYGSQSGAGVSWTATEIDYVLEEKKRLFAYVRKLSNEQIRLVDPNEEKLKKLEEFIGIVKAHVPVVPRYNHGNQCQLVAMVIRDVYRYAQKLRDKAKIAEKETYLDSFTG